MVSEQAAAVIRELRAQRQTARGEVTLAEMRASIDERLSTVDPVPTSAAVTRWTVDGLPVQLVEARGASSNRRVLLLHGGGYVTGSNRSHAGFAARVSAACAAPVLQIEYRLAPEHPFPAALDDAIRGYMHLLSTGVASRDVALVGDSAGGGLLCAAMVWMREHSIDLPGAAAAISPWADLTLSGKSMIANADLEPKLTRAQLESWATFSVGAHSPGNALISPVFADLRGLPPISVQAGSHEVLLSDADRLLDALRAADVSVEMQVIDAMFHGFHFYPELPETQAALERLGSFVRRHLGKPR